MREAQRPLLAEVRFVVDTVWGDGAVWHSGRKRRERRMRRMCGNDPGSCMVAGLVDNCHARRFLQIDIACTRLIGGVRTPKVRAAIICYAGQSHYSELWRR